MNIDDKVKDRIAKIKALADRGVDGEKTAASIQLDKMLKKYNLSDEDLDKIKLKKYFFKYKTNLDKRLFGQLINFFFKDQDLTVYQNNNNGKDLQVEMEYLDYVTLSCSYEYFRGHAAKQFNDFCLPHVKRCRTTKTKNAKRAELQDAFFSKYVIASNIYHPEHIKQVDWSGMSNKELEASHKRASILGDVQGGQYHTQVAKETLKIE